jgi:hypothetical protein
MNEPVNPDRIPADDEADAHFDAALKAAFGRFLSVFEQVCAAGRLDNAFTRLNSCGSEGELIRLAKRCLGASRAVRPRHAGVLAREITAFLASVGDRARTAEVAAAEARATAAALGVAIDEDARKNIVRLIDELRKEEQSVRERARQHRASQGKAPSESLHPPRQDQE